MERRETSGTAVGPLRRPLLFLAVVWAIGGAFLALESGFAAFVKSLPRWFPAVNALPRQSEAARVHCQQVVKDFPQRTADRGLPTAYLAWRLGYVLGVAEGLVITGAQGVQGGELIRSSKPLSQALWVPDVTLPARGAAAYGLRDFAVFLAEDPQCVATTLESRYSPRHSALFRFGAAIGTASVWRQAAPEIGPILEPQIQIYGAAAQVPSQLAQPLLEKSIPAPPGVDARLEVENIAQRIDAFIKTGK
jgi:hypothetical protein